MIKRSPKPEAMSDPLRDDPRIEVDPTALGGGESRLRAAADQVVRVTRAALATSRHARSGRIGIDAVRLQGRDPRSGERLTVLYIGNGADLEYVRDLAFGAPVPMTVLERRRSPLAVRGLLRRHRAGADVVVVDTNLVVERFIVPPDLYRLPRWVKQTLAVGGSAQSVRVRVGTHTLARARRVLRRHGYRVDLEATEQARLHFFHELYRPFLRARFGTHAIVVDEERFHRETRCAGVLRLWSGTEVIAALVVRAAGEELQIVWFGARTDAAGRGLKGLSDALDYAALCVARRGGFERLHFGSSRPSLADGVLRYKQKWGATIVPGRLPRADLRLAVDPTSAAALAFLERTRPIVRFGSVLCEFTPDDVMEPSSARDAARSLNPATDPRS